MRHSHTQPAASAIHALSPTFGLARCTYLLGVLGICWLALDFLVWGPVREWAWQSWVVAPVERAWGFHAEWQTLPGHGTHLVITSVQRGGAFAGAGIAPGAVLPHPACGWYTLLGGFYAEFSEGREAATFRIITEPSQYPGGILVRVQRKPAT